MPALSYAQAGTMEQAREQVQEILKLEPGFSGEAWVDNDIYEPGGSSARLFFAGARKAGLPLCTPASEAATFAPLNRLPECDALRARQAVGSLSAHVLRSRRSRFARRCGSSTRR